MGRLFANKEFFEICDMTEESTIHSDTAESSNPQQQQQTWGADLIVDCTCRTCQVSIDLSLL